jgi:hypothetical protein
MSKIIATLAIVSLFVSLASCGTTTQSGSISSTYLNSSATKVYGVNSSTSGSADATWITLPYSNIAFGPATTNSTLYTYGWTVSGTTITIYKRSSNATIVGYGNDTVEASYIPSDSTISATGVGSSGTASIIANGVGQGYLGLLATGTDSSGYSQVYFILVSGTSPTVKVVTSNTGTITYSSGALYYDVASYTFFYTFLGSFYDSGSSAPYTITINLGGYNASAPGLYFAAGSYSTNAGTTYTSTGQVTNLVIGGDNFTNASNIYIAYKDTKAAVSYYVKTTKATTTTTLGSPQSIVADSTVSTNMTTYAPIGVWASNYTYGISLSIESVVSSGTPIYKIANFYNATTLADSGIDYSTTTYMALAVYGFELNTGYALLGVYQTSTSGSYAITYASFYANATLNTTSNGLVTLASTLSGPFNIFEDANGAEWIGWTDYTTSSGTTVTAYGYLAKLQGQDFPAFANALKGIMAFVAFCLAAVFAF